MYMKSQIKSPPIFNPRSKCNLVLGLTKVFSGINSYDVFLHIILCSIFGMKCLFESMLWRQEVYLQVHSFLCCLDSHLALLGLKSAKFNWTITICLEFSFFFSYPFFISFVDFLSCVFPLLLGVACLPAVVSLDFFFSFLIFLFVFTCSVLSYPV